MLEIVPQLDYASPSSANCINVQVCTWKAFRIDEEGGHVAVVCSEYGELVIDLSFDIIFDKNQRACMFSLRLCGR